MWVRLTRSQWGAVMDLVNPQVQSALTTELIDRGGRDVWVRAPFAAWELVAEVCEQRVFTPKGARRGGVRFLGAALRTVAREMNAVLKHPALRAVAMIGHHAVVIPAWRQDPRDDFDRVWWPSPIIGAEFVVLRPTWHDEGGRRLTTWGRDGIGSRNDWLNDEASHLAVGA